MWCPCLNDDSCSTVQRDSQWCGYFALTLRQVASNAGLKPTPACTEPAKVDSFTPVYIKTNRWVTTGLTVVDNASAQRTPEV